MEQLILQIKNKRKLPFLKELLQQLNFVEVVEPAKQAAAAKKKNAVLTNLEESIHEVKRIKAGKLKGIPAKDLLNEL